VPELLPRFRRFQEQIEDERKVAKAILEAGASLEEAERSVPIRGSANGWNRDRARGVPIIGRIGGSGATPGSNPLAAVLRSESQPRRR
jgi:hypothetical protein